MVVTIFIVSINKNQSNILGQLRIKPVLKRWYHITTVLGLVELLLVLEIWHPKVRGSLVKARTTSDSMGTSLDLI
jgi:hypothetical protein